MLRNVKNQMGLTLVVIEARHPPHHGAGRTDRGHGRPDGSSPSVLLPEIQRDPLGDRGLSRHGHDCDRAFRPGHGAGHRRRCWPARPSSRATGERGHGSSTRHPGHQAARWLKRLRGVYRLLFAVLGVAIAYAVAAPAYAASTGNHSNHIYTTGRQSTLTGAIIILVIAAISIRRNLRRSVGGMVEMTPLASGQGKSDPAPGRVQLGGRGPGPRPPDRGLRALEQHHGECSSGAASRVRLRFPDANCARLKGDARQRRSTGRPTDRTA